MRQQQKKLYIYYKLFLLYFGKVSVHLNSLLKVLSKLLKTEYDGKKQKLGTHK